MFISYLKDSTNHHIVLGFHSKEIPQRRVTRLRTLINTIKLYQFNRSKKIISI